MTPEENPCLLFSKELVSARLRDAVIFLASGLVLFLLSY